MGDIVHNLPVIADLRRARPDDVVDWVVEEAYVDLVRMVRGVTRVLPVALRRWRQQPHRSATHRERRAFDEALRAERYDLVLDTQGLLKSALIARRARLAQGGVRAGFSYALVRESLARLFYDEGYAVDPRMHAIERMRALAAQACGYADDDKSQPLGLPRFELDVPPSRPRGSTGSWRRVATSSSFTPQPARRRPGLANAGPGCSKSCAPPA